MSNKLKFLILLLVISLIILLYLVLSAKIVSIKSIETGNNQTALVENKVDLKELENNYQQSVKSIMREYYLFAVNMNNIATSSAISGENSELKNKIIQLKTRLLQLRVPTNYKDLHLNLVLAFSKIESYFDNKSSKDKADSVRIIDQEKNSNKWLNEK